MDAHAKIRMLTKAALKAADEGDEAKFDKYAAMLEKAERELAEAAKRG